MKEGDLDGLARADWKADVERLGSTVVLLTPDDAGGSAEKVVPCLGEEGFRRSVMEMVEKKCPRFVECGCRWRGATQLLITVSSVSCSPAPKINTFSFPLFVTSFFKCNEY